MEIPQRLGRGIPIWEQDSDWSGQHILGGDETKSSNASDETRALTHVTLSRHSMIPNSNVLLTLQLALPIALNFIASGEWETQ